MGYRNYIGYLPKRKYNQLKSLTVGEIYEFMKVNRDDDYVGVYNFGVELYEYGKYVDFKPPKNSMKTFFKKKESQEYWNSDNELFVVTKEFLEYTINYYRDRVRTYYSNLLDTFYESDIYIESSEFLKSKKRIYTGSSKNEYDFDVNKITPKEKSAIVNIIQHVSGIASEWGVKNSIIEQPYDLNGNDNITSSWKYEYAIFELIRIYKSFDWKRNVMIYYGY